MMSLGSIPAEGLRPAPDTPEAATTTTSSGSAKPAASNGDRPKITEVG